MKLSPVEKFLLIAHHPTKGRFIIADMYVNYGIIGAILLEMSLENRVIIENKKLILKNNENTDNHIISEISTMISSSKKPRTIQYWINKFVRKSRKYKWIILNELTNNNLIRIENKKFLGLIPYKRSYLTPNITREDLIQQLKNNILFRQELSNENIVMLALIEVCNMHKIITSDRAELKTIRKELKQIMKDNPIADSIDKTIKQVQAAIITAIIASSIASSAGSR